MAKDAETDLFDAHEDDDAEPGEELDLDTFMVILRGQVTDFKNSAQESIEDGEIDATMLEADWMEHFFAHVGAMEDDEEE